MDGKNSKVPVSILTGFLGAGKTSLVQHILKAKHGKRVAVIQNEFAEEMGIESPVITDADGNVFQEMYEMPNGCICCAVRDDLVMTLERLLTQRQKFDHVVIETNGVADPETVVNSFWVDNQLDSQMYLDGVVTVVDARNVFRSLALAFEVPQREIGDQEEEEAFLELVRKLESSKAPSNHVVAADASATRINLGVLTAKQISCGDVLLLNKLDLIPQADSGRIADGLSRLLRGVNRTAPIFRTTNCVVDLEKIFGLLAYESSRIVKEVKKLNHNIIDVGSETETLAWRRVGDADAEGSSCGSSSSCEPRSCTHREANRGLPRSALVRLSGRHPLLSAKKVERWVGELLWEKTHGEIIRCKGLFWAAADMDDDSPQADDEGTGVGGWHTLQGVGDVYEVDRVTAVAENGLTAVPPADIVSKFLFVGESVDEAQIARELVANCCSGPPV